MAIRRKTGLPTPTLEPRQTREFLRTVKESVEVAQRERGEATQSFVRLGELIDAGVATPTGEIVPNVVDKTARRLRAMSRLRGC